MLRVQTLIRNQKENIDLVIKILLKHLGEEQIQKISADLSDGIPANQKSGSGKDELSHIISSSLEIQSKMPQEFQ